MYQLTGEFSFPPFFRPLDNLLDKNASPFPKFLYFTIPRLWLYISRRNVDRSLAKLRFIDYPCGNMRHLCPSIPVPFLVFVSGFLIRARDFLIRARDFEPPLIGRPGFANDT